MKQDGRLSGVLHLLIHMVERDQPMTSEMLARAMRTNPVVIRRMMAGLRDQKIVRSEKGHGGGWTLMRPPAEITLRHIYAALGAPRLLALGHRSAAPECLVEQAVNAALDDAFDDAQRVFLARLDRVTLAALRQDFHERLRPRTCQNKDDFPHE